MKQFLLISLILLIPGGILAENQAAPKDPVPEGFQLIEGDILVPVDREGKGIYATNLWPNGVIPYVFDANVTAANQATTLNAMASWEAVANIDFVPRNSEINYVHIQDNTMNNSMIGMVGGMQIINIFNWNLQFVIAHELAHTLGMWHEQSRPDRDSYVSIEFDRIVDGEEHNFDMHPSEDIHGPYDFDSVMHYSQCAFSCCNVTVDPCCSAPCSCDSDLANCRTITVLPPHAAEWQDAIGQTDHLSKIDKATAGFMYPRPEWVFVDCEAEGVIENGTPDYPYQSLQDGIDAVSAGEILKIQPCIYDDTGVFDKAMTWDAPIGGVVIGGY